ncbi:putative short chain dehydrogenase [Seiridium cardinale]|uniref:Short chain dehydrogenase n=1 Tax=Seiridium cardinale TaxID=138064 RepID=A0ABR2XF39_9PEZI
MSPLDISRLFGVRGYVALVTGGSSGLGYMICKGLVVNGARVYLVALPTEPIDEKVAELNQLGRTSGGSATGYACDVSSKDSIANLAAYVAEKEERLDILVSNAGIRRDPPVQCNVLSASLEELQASMWSHHHEDWADTFAVNTTAHYFLSVAFLPLLAAASRFDVGSGAQGRNEGRGVVVVTSSCASMHNMTNIDLTSYASSKAATDHLVRLLAAKFSRFYVRVNGLNPGFVPSKMNPVGEEGNIFSNLFDQVPAKRPGGEDDIASAVIYLASRAGAYIDGISLCIDGGRILFANGQQ